MKTKSNEDSIGKSNLQPGNQVESRDLTAEELFHIEGGEDLDMDEDCYVLQCLVGAECVVLSEW